MAAITAPYLLDAGRQADWGYFCLGCREDKEEGTRHFRIKYTREDILEHVARETRLFTPWECLTSLLHRVLIQDLLLLPTRRLNALAQPRDTPSLYQIAIAHPQRCISSVPGMPINGSVTAALALSFSAISPEGKKGRVIGFAVEWVQGARAAGPRDIGSCKKALGRLHELGIKSGDINKHNFLVRDGHDVVLVDFEAAKQNCSSEELEGEMSNLNGSLQDTSSLGGVEPLPE